MKQDMLMRVVGVVLFAIGCVCLYVFISWRRQSARTRLQDRLTAQHNELTYDGYAHLVQY